MNTILLTCYCLLIWGHESIKIFSEMLNFRSNIINSPFNRFSLSYPSSLVGQSLLINSPLTSFNQLRFRYQYLRHRVRVKRDMLRREAVSEFEVRRMVLKALHRDHRLDMKTRLRAMMTLHSLNSYTRPNAIHSRCVETGRGQGLIKGFCISRIRFREAAINGRIPGLIKAVW